MLTPKSLADQRPNYSEVKSPKRAQLNNRKSPA
jgi:hypothetical protein